MTNVDPATAERMFRNTAGRHHNRALHQLRTAGELIVAAIRDLENVAPDSPAANRNDIHLAGGHLGRVLAEVTDAAGRLRVLEEMADLEPLLFKGVERLGEILAGSVDEVEWTTRIHYTNGRPPNDGQPQPRELAKMAVAGINMDDNAEFRAAKDVDRSEVVRREVRHLRDGSTLVGVWHVPAEPED